VFLPPNQPINGREKKTVNTMPYRYLCVIDFEATCDNGPKKLIPQEIIEFPSVLMQFQRDERQVVHCLPLNTTVVVNNNNNNNNNNSSSNSSSSSSISSISGEFQRFIKPMKNPKLTKFCQELTGITQEQVDQNGISMEQAMKEHKAWLEKQLGEPPTENNVLMVTCGDWDLKTCLPDQMQLLNQEYDSYLKQWCNLKLIFARHCVKHWDNRKRRADMVDMLDALHIPLVGKHHSGIDDCRNISRIVSKMVEEGGCVFLPTGNNTRNKFTKMPLPSEVSVEQVFHIKEVI
jgi:inhibitor of KinA sporulation pathway (predicted exonuclease)